MSISEQFSAFCLNLKMDSDTIETIQGRYHQITKRINLDYWNSASDINHSLYVGSYGRGTEIWTSDIDMIVELPAQIYYKYNNYESNGQSALLQDLKNVLQKTYSSSFLKGDGQVVGINFYDNINFEIVPVFINCDNSYIYPDTHNNGSWKITDPKKEIKAINKLNNDSNKNLKQLCKMLRSWKEHCNVGISGILIDTLAYNFMQTWEYKTKSFLYYDYLTRDIFDYLQKYNSIQKYWLAPGSNRRVYKKEDFYFKAKVAYNNAIKAINTENKFFWRNIYGKRFPI